MPARTVSRLGLASLACLLLAWSLPARAGAPAGVEKVIEGIRAEFKAVEDAAEGADGAQRLPKAEFALGGGQNPLEYVVHYRGPSQADLERDPYAEVFEPRRIKKTRTEPAVGPSTETYYYRPDGTLFFAFLTGTHACGAMSESCPPPSELRVYFEKGKVVRVILRNYDGGEQSATRDRPVDGSPAGQVGRAALERGQRLYKLIKELAG
ncbi:MAG TPA: hypothetical protein PK668_26245 [Myxococcota bacterium]|nr:hypothetical protein [Myxococcota bacterium]HRY97028.1 hypothetical protein [Myxococcota bacterium]HSA23809.1 hypothetical protein [Myxococcota bacterium]